MNQNRINEILDFAIAREQEAHDFYQKLADQMDREEMNRIFRKFASEELKHKIKIEALKTGRFSWPQGQTVQDLRISDQVEEIAPETAVDFQKALILALKREQASFKLYTALAETALDEQVRQTFSGLAQEEAKHKLRLEIEYDEFVLREH